MSHRLLPRLAASILVLSTGPVLPISGSSPTALADSDPVETVETPEIVATVEIVDLPADIEAMADWALGLFDEAGMELPPVRILHHGEDTQPCRGRIGYHRPEDGRSIIHLCTNTIDFPTQAMILHELAHAWVDRNVDDEVRQAFQELRGYEHWRNYDEARWHENGTEQAAEIIAWGLFDRPMAMLRIDRNSCDELEAGYRTLTSAAPLHGFRDKCS